MHTLQVQLILLCNITPQHTLRSSIKDSITHNSTAINFGLQILIEDLYVMRILLLHFYEKVLLNQARRSQAGARLVS